MRLFTGFPVENDFLNAATALFRSAGNINGLRWVPGVNLHVTACFIGEVAPNKLAAIKAATGEIAALSRPVTLGFQDICLWPKRNPYMVWALFEENQDFTRIYRQLEKALTGKTGQGSVKPHITLARFKEFTDTRQIPLTGIPFPGQIPCNRLILFESRLAPDGAAYFPLAQYPFP